MKKLLISLVLAIVLLTAPAFAGGIVFVGSGAGVISGNVGNGVSYQTAGNHSEAGYNVQTWHNGGPFNGNSGREVTTWASSQGGTIGGHFGNGFNAGVQAGFGTVIAW